MKWLERGLEAVRIAVRKKGGVHPARHLKLAPQPPEGLRVKFALGNVLSLGFHQKKLGNPFQRPTFVNVYIQETGAGAVRFLKQSNAFNATEDLDGTLTTGVDLSGADPGTYKVSIAAANAYGETFCIRPDYVIASVV